MKEIKISDKEQGQRLDKFLKKYFKQATGGFLYKMMRKKNITLNNNKATGQEMLQENDIIKVFFSDDTFEVMRGGNESLQDYHKLLQVPYEDLHVIYETPDIMAVNKPAGLLSQKATDSDISINEKILSYLMHTNALTPEEYAVFHPSIANRLDRNTSGLLLAGKSLAGQQYLSRLMKERTADKCYHCLVKGNLTEETRLEGYLLKDERTNQVQITDKMVSDAKRIETFYRPLEQLNNCCLLEVHLITGRTHQIRAHLASIHHPILGDTKYGDITYNRKLRDAFGLKHQLLHAYSMTLPEGDTITAPHPKLFTDILNQLR